MAENLVRTPSLGGARLIDRYVLKMALWPLAGALGVTLVALLLERVLRLLDMLSASSDRFGFVAELAANLVPHYLGLTLPAAFFIAMFVVISRLGDGSEIDALLASGVSISRIVAPYLVLGGVLALISIVLFGFVQPYSRYGYRAVLHAAENAGWNGRLQGATFVSPNDKMVMTADLADAGGRKLERIFIRETGDDGRERVTTAHVGQIQPDSDGKKVTLILTDGQQVRTNKRGEAEVLAFKSLSIETPLAGAAKLLRARGGDERELTLWELFSQAREPHGPLPRQTLLAELFGRLARALALPLLPLLALPLGLAAKRGGRAPGMIIAGLLLLAFQHTIQFGQSLAESGRALAIFSVGAPFLGFAAICLWIFMTSRKRPGETPVGQAVDHISDAIRRVREFFVPRRPQADA